MNNVRTIPVYAISVIEAALAKINRKAGKLGAAGFRVEFGPVRVETRQVQAEDTCEAIEVEVVDATILGEPVQVSGYRLLSRIDFEGELVLVNSRPGEQLPERFRSTTPLCQHCASQRKRKSVFVFRRDGDEQHVQVGSSCLKDFLGHDPAALLQSMRLWDELCGEMDREERGYGWREAQVIGVLRVLEMTNAVVRADNGVFTSRAAANAAYDRGQHLQTTSSKVFAQLFPPPYPPKDWVTITATEEDAAAGQAAIEWARESFGRSGSSEYEHNLLKLVGVERVNLKRLGMLASLIGAYRRHLGIQAERAKKVNAHVGAVGQRAEFDVTFDGATSYETDYGTTYIGRFNSPAGQLVYKGGSPFWPSSIKPGDALRVKATIKKHDEYKGFAQTYIQRPVIAAQAAR